MSTLADEGARLIKALALSQRFHLYIAHCASPRAADRWIGALTTKLPVLRGEPVHVVRLEPYDAQATDAPLTTELYDRVLLPLLDAPAQRRGHGTIHVVDASRAPATDDETWAQLFARWNERRNRLQRLGGEVVVLLPSALALMFATEAPDVWSIRSGEYQLGEPSRSDRRSPADVDAVRGFDDAVPPPPRRSPARPAARAPAMTGRGAASLDDGAPSDPAGAPGTARRDVAEQPPARSAPPRSALAIDERAPVTDAQIADDAGASPLERLAAWRLLPPLSLFAGDLEIAPWLQSVFQRRQARDITSPDPTMLDDSRQALRAAELAISDQRFADARAELARLGEARDADALIAVRLELAHALVLAASDDAGAAWPRMLRALDLADQLPMSPRVLVMPDVREIAAFIAWCRGDLARADTLAAEALIERPRDAVQQGRYDVQALLLAIVRGDLGRAHRVAAQIAPLQSIRATRKARDGQAPGSAQARRVVAANLAFVDSDLAAARRDLDDATLPFDERSLADDAVILGRARPFAALLAAAQGDLAGADRVLHGARKTPRPAVPPPEANARRVAFRCYATGIIASERGDVPAALEAFDQARQAIAYGAERAFDRRALGRADAATLLCACEIDDDPERATAAACEAQAIADRLVGETGEDHVARVLAVLARRARRRLTTDPPLARSLAREAADLFAPVRGDGATTWATLAEQCDDDVASDAG